MPLPDGTLTDEEFGKASIRLWELWTANGGRKPCRSCGEKGFYIHPALNGNRSDTVAIGSAHTRLPTVVVYCKQCGLAEEYVARSLGIEVLQVDPDGVVS